MLARAAFLGWRTGVRATRVGAPVPMFARNLSAVAPQGRVPVLFVDVDGEEMEVQAEVGDSLLDVAHENDIEIEGACGGECACSTCHVVLDKSVYDSLPEPNEEEEDMLDLALGLTETSRLGCQIKVSEDMAGMRVRLPDDVHNLQP